MERMIASNCIKLHQIASQDTPPPAFAHTRGTNAARHHHRRRRRGRGALEATSHEARLAVFSKVVLNEAKRIYARKALRDMFKS